MSVLKWLGKIAQSTIDPNREARVKHLEAIIANGFKSQGQKFSVDQIQLSSDFAPADLEDAANSFYLKHLKLAWADQIVTAKEKGQLNFLEAALRISKNKVDSMRTACVKDAFESVLAKSMDDGVISERERKHLSHIAAQLGCTLGDFANAYFKEQSENFLRGMFLKAINDGELTNREWDNLISTVELLGISKDEFLLKIQPQAIAFVEHVLADAKADDCIQQPEEEQLLWLLRNLKLPKGFHAYVKGEIDNVKLLQQIESGILPSIKVPKGLETVGGELVHVTAGCDFHQTRNLRSGPETTTHRGCLVITDRKTVFVSETKSFRVSYRSILGHFGNNRFLKLQAQNKPEILLELRKPDQTTYPIFKAALAIANQTKTAKVDLKKTRHITRDVRQTIWRQYGGRCAECNATDYLEFDHIIPVAKGGSNSESNVQLLCRRCNSRKSDKI